MTRTTRRTSRRRGPSPRHRGCKPVAFERARVVDEHGAIDALEHEQAAGRGTEYAEPTQQFLDVRNAARVRLMNVPIVISLAKVRLPLAATRGWNGRLTRYAR